MTNTAAPSPRTLSALAARATGVRFRATTTKLTGTVRVALAAAPDNGTAHVATAAEALRAAGYRVRVIADGWQLAVAAA